MLRSLTTIPVGLVRNWYLIRQMTWRDITGRYKGSIMGILWSFLNPLLMLTLYTMVFGVMFKVRWTSVAPSNSAAGIGESPADFALVMFVGLILHSFLAECLTRSPGLVVGNVNFVKRVMFPLEILGWSAIASALFHSAISFLGLLVIGLIFHGTIPWTIVLLPVVVIPFAVLALGLVWFLAATGVFVRDIGQAVQPLVTVLLFLSPILTPPTAVPDWLRPLIVLNPLTVPVEQARALVIWGVLPDWWQLGVYALVAVLVAWLGALWFSRCRPAFADVL